MRTRLFTLAIVTGAALAVAAPTYADPETKPHAEHHGHKVRVCRDVSTKGGRTTGTVLGAVAGGLLGNALTHGKTGGTVVGAGAGAVVGHQYAKHNSTHKECHDEWRD